MRLETDISLDASNKHRKARKFAASCRTAFKERDALQVKEIEETHDDDDDEDPDEIDLRKGILDDKSDTIHFRYQRSCNPRFCYI